MILSKLTFKILIFCLEILSLPILEHIVHHTGYMQMVVKRVLFRTVVVGWLRKYSQIMRTKLYVNSLNQLIGPYQCSFRPGKSTIDQTFILLKILEKTQEKQVETHHLFLDYKATVDSPGIVFLPQCLSSVYLRS